MVLSFGISSTAARQLSSEQRFLSGPAQTEIGRRPYLSEKRPRQPFSVRFQHAEDAQDKSRDAAICNESRAFFWTRKKWGNRTISRSLRRAEMGPASGRRLTTTTLCYRSSITTE